MGSRRPPFVPSRALIVAGALALAACGSSDPAPAGGDEGSGASPTFATNDSTAELAVDVGGDVAVEADPIDPATAADAGDAAGIQPAALGGRALAEAIEPASEVPTNLLPDLVVDDVTRGTKVNLRNIFPADRPVLLWMWAPH